MTLSNPTISIIIPHWNGIEIISECISSIKKSKFSSYEIIVSDNMSTDGSQDWIKKNYPDIRLVENKKNYGYSGGCNKGAEIALGDYLLFLNNDTIHDENWIEPLVEKIKSDSNIGAVQPKILNYFNRSLFDYAGGSGGHMDIFCYPFARGRVFLDQEEDVGQYNNPEKCFWASGTTLLIKKKLFFESGKFDELFFAHMEEIDLCWRIQIMGYSVWSEPNSVVYHKNAVSLPMYSHKKYYLNHRNSLLMLFSNYSIPLAFYIGTIRWMLEIVALIYSILKLDFNHATGIIRALFWIILHPHEVIKRRIKLRNIRKIKDYKLMKNMEKSSTIIRYYLLGQATYSDIKSKAS